MRLEAKLLLVIALFAFAPVFLVSAVPAARPLLVLLVVSFVGAWLLSVLGLVIDLVLFLGDRDDAARASRPARGRRWLGPLVAVVLGLPAILAASIVVSRELPHALPTGSHARKFDAAAWASPTSTRWEPKRRVSDRQAMLGDLIQNVLPGMSEAEIRALLGAPREGGSAGDAALEYETGPVRDAIVPTHTELLRIGLDANGRYERYVIGSD